MGYQNISSSQEKIKRIFYSASEDRINEFYNIFNKYARDFRIEDEVQENFFLAQIVAETGHSLSAGRENLNYSCRSLKSTFKFYKRNPKNAARDGRCNGHRANYQNIGNKAYANRIGNGGISSGDGYRFRGGGYFQLTGRSNYAIMAGVIQRVTHEETRAEDVERYITEPSMGLLSAMAFWVRNKCYECDHINCVTRKINRYTHSYTKRKHKYQWIAGL